MSYLFIHQLQWSRFVCFLFMKYSLVRRLWNNWPVIHAWPFSLWSDAIMRRSQLDLFVLQIHWNTFTWWDRFSAVLCLTAVFFADTVRKTEVLSEVLKIPGSIKCHGNGDKEHTSKYPWLVSPVNKVSSACVGVWESLCCWHQKKSTFTWVTHRIMALEYIWWNMDDMVKLLANSCLFTQIHQLWSYTLVFIWSLVPGHLMHASPILALFKLWFWSPTTSWGEYLFSR